MGSRYPPVIVYHLLSPHVAPVSPPQKGKRNNKKGMEGHGVRFVAYQAGVGPEAGSL